MCTPHAAAGGRGAHPGGAAAAGPPGRRRCAADTVAERCVGLKAEQPRRWWRSSSMGSWVCQPPRISVTHACDVRCACFSSNHGPHSWSSQILLTAHISGRAGELEDAFIEVDLTSSGRGGSGGGIIDLGGGGGGPQGPVVINLERLMSGKRDVRTLRVRHGVSEHGLKLGRHGWHFAPGSAPGCEPALPGAEAVCAVGAGRRRVVGAAHVWTGCEFPGYGRGCRCAGARGAVPAGGL